MLKTRSNSLKVGILIRDFDTLANYEYRIIQSIILDPDLDLCLLMKDGRTELKSVKGKLLRNVYSRGVLSNVLFRLQSNIEEKLFPEKITVDKAAIIEELKKVKCIELFPARKGFLDIFSEEESEEIKSYDLDIILRHEFGIIRGPILNSAKHGIWSFHHGDNAFIRGAPAGFWEIVFNKPTVGVTLQQLTSTLDGGNVIDKAFFNWDYSYILTYNSILEGSVSLLLKNIGKLKRGEIKYQKSLVYFNPLFKRPTLKYIFIYSYKFYMTILKKAYYKLMTKITSKRELCWALYAAKGNFLEATLFNKKEVLMPKGEFWADPFLLRHDNELFAFFENYVYSEGRGKISCAKIVDNKFVDVKDVLVLPYHLSYPFMYKEGGDIFMIPETASNKRVEVYKCTRFPDKWELFTTAFEGEQIVDSTYHKDENGDSWLFLNKGFRQRAELHIYKVDSLQLNSLIPHQLNPVKIDSSSARNGGAIFKYEDHYCRPSQVNTYGKYGNGLNINRIIKLNINEYEEEKITTVYPNFKKGLMGMHHLHQIDNYYLFDVCYQLK